MTPDLRVLKAALAQLNAKWRGKASFTLQSDAKGLPVFIGHGEQIPSGFPGVMVVPSQKGPWKVPVRWVASSPASPKVEMFNHHGNRPLDPFNDKDIDRAYWWFFTPAPERPLTTFEPAFHALPEPTLGEIPTADHIDPVMFFDARLPQYDTPNFWAKAFEPYGCLCCTFYERPTVVYTSQVPEMSLIVIDGISFSSTAAFAVGETFVVEILRDGETLLQFEEVVIDPANPDDAHKFLFTGHGQPVPLWMRFDRNQMITVRITFKGVYPFQKTPLDSFCGTLCVLLHGWTASLMDNRDGTARPVDVGAMRDLGGEDVLVEESAARARLIAQWLSESTEYVQ